MTMLQAHRGLRAECPENTMPAFLLAIEQGYSAIETDPLVTKDLQVVLHHDRTINRTARRADGTALTQELAVEELTYEELLAYDFGIYKHPKFAGTRLPLLKELLPLARQAGVRLKLDAKIFMLPDEQQQVIFELIEDWQDVCQLSTKTVEQTLWASLRFPQMQLHYGGPCEKEALEAMKEVGRDRLTLWLPYPNMRTAYAYGPLPGLKPEIRQVPVLTPERVRLAKKYGKVAVWNLAEEAEYTEVQIMGVHLAETDGEVKPVRNLGVLSDMHTHCSHSHDSTAPMEQIYSASREKGIKIIAAADHYDGCFCADGPYDWSHIRASNAEADAITARYGGDGMILRSIEMGEPQWDPQQSKRVLAESDFDVVVGAIHAVKSPMFEDKQLLKRAFSQLKYDQLTAAQIHQLLEAYYRDNLEMVRTQNIDICAHLTCAVGYFLSRHGIFVGVEQFREEITAILKTIIQRGIALEVNFSGLPTAGVLSPHLWILELYRSLGGYLITVATDAHAPGGCGRGYEQGIPLLKKLGFKHIYYYKDRKPVQCTLL